MHPRVSHGMTQRGLFRPPGIRVESGMFGRMFPNLSPRGEDTVPTPEQLGLSGGPMDGGGDKPDNPRITAGWTFFGQFVDHDMTFDPTSDIERRNDPNAIHNFRTPQLELDNLYGSGPGVQPFLYDNDGSGRLLLTVHAGSPETGDLRVDVPRNSQNTALIGDPRNDENLIVSQLHAAFIAFHNRLINAGIPFEEAQRLVRWHYQWIIVHEFLPLICGDGVVEQVQASRRRSYDPVREPFMPVEFSVAAYRLGHAMVRNGYSINETFGAGLFNQAGNDLRGGRAVTADRAVDFARFFQVPGGAFDAQQAKEFDSTLSGALFTLPATVVGSDPAPLTSLAFRNLKRSIALLLPSGEAVARAMRVAPLSPDVLYPDARPIGFEKPNPKTASTPLWYYILREGKVLGNDGKHLGPVGARIVAEVFVGLLETDPLSYLSQDPAWTPTLHEHFDFVPEGRFAMIDLLRVAGVLPTQVPAPAAEPVEEPA